MVAVTIRRLGLELTVAALFVLAVVDMVQHYHVEPIFAYLLGAVRVAPLLIYRRWPVEAWLIELFAVLATAVVTVPVTPNEPWPWSVTSTAALAALAGLVSSLGRRQLSVVMLGVVTGVGFVLALWPGRGDWVSGVLMTMILCGAALITGDFVHGRRRMAVELAEERKVSAEERGLRSVVEERARIARELHDVVAHHMSMITVQAETARFRHADLPKAAAAEFTEIAQVARESLSELRGLLSALRDNSADAHRTPQPTLADLPALVERITAAGTPVTLKVTTETADLPRVTQLAVYRIVQESLSNVVRHAPGATTQVEIARTHDTLRTEVINERPPTPSRQPDVTGHGLVGLRERTTLLGGTFQTDQPNGGWRVRAELPLRPRQ
jgi:signal transduction histidine kinase